MFWNVHKLKTLPDVTIIWMYFQQTSKSTENKDIFFWFKYFEVKILRSVEEKCLLKEVAWHCKNFSVDLLTKPRFFQPKTFYFFLFFNGFMAESRWHKNNKKRISLRHWFVKLSEAKFFLVIGNIRNLWYNFFKIFFIWLV